jgi:hypothetical protein
MVFVFGIDIPLVELIFVLTLVLILLFVLMIYLTISQIRLNRLLKQVLANENIELKDLRDITAEEKDELELLRLVRSELEKLVHGKEYGKKMEYLIGSKSGSLSPEEEKIHILTNSFWNQIVKLRGKGEEKKRSQAIRNLEKEKRRIEALLKRAKKTKRSKR